MVRAIGSSTECSGLGVVVVSEMSQDANVEVNSVSPSDQMVFECCDRTRGDARATTIMLQFPSSAATRTGPSPTLPTPECLRKMPFSMPSPEFAATRPLADADQSGMTAPRARQAPAGSAATNTKKKRVLHKERPPRQRPG